MHNFLRYGSPSGRQPIYSTHTPATYRSSIGIARRRLFPSTPISTPISTPPPMSTPPTRAAYAPPPLPNTGSFSTPAASAANNAAQTTTQQNDLILPWREDFRKIPSQLFTKSIPKLAYPTGSTDEGKNLHFIQSALGYLRSSSYVRDVLDWDPRPHPFYHLQSLKDFMSGQGYTNYILNLQKLLPQYSGLIAYHQLTQTNCAQF